MAWEWAGPLATLAGGIAGMAGTWLVSRTQGKIAIEQGKISIDTAKVTADTTLKLAREERHQKRIDSVYQQLGKSLSAVECHLCRLTYSETGGPEQSLDDLPDEYFPAPVVAALSRDTLYQSDALAPLVSELENDLRMLDGHFSAVHRLRRSLATDPELMNSLAGTIADRAAHAIDVIGRARKSMRDELRGAEASETGR
ncbi:hypothetical protein [Actinoplanes sp. NPDC049316]|uniref:hypothetical protein n=1 Tax=Actinoplanes sp. NPDC049316 TaxID=3154727 RepID=UPI00342B20A0